MLFRLAVCLRSEVSRFKINTFVINKWPVELSWLQFLPATIHNTVSSMSFNDLPKLRTRQFVHHARSSADQRGDPFFEAQVYAHPRTPSRILSQSTVYAYLSAYIFELASSLPRPEARIRPHKYQSHRFEWGNTFKLVALSSVYAHVSIAHVCIGRLPGRSHIRRVSTLSRKDHQDGHRTSWSIMGFGGPLMAH